MLALYLRLQNWLVAQEEGQDLVEYALLLVLIAIVVIAAVRLLGTTVSSVMSNAASGITN